MSSATGMSARDYQHKRLRQQQQQQQQQRLGPATTESPYKQQEASPTKQVLSSSSPRIVTPQSSSKPVEVSLQPPTLQAEQKAEPNLFSTPPRKTGRTLESATMEDPSPTFMHQPTVTTGGLTSASPLRVEEPMRYSLSKGKQSPADIQKRYANRRASDQGGIVSPPQNPPKSESSRRASEPSPKPSSSSYRRSSSGTGGAGSRIRKHDPNAYKIFILLLQPESKIFELIQLIYNPNDTSVGNILTMIPENATEKALGTQQYVGLCRPKTQEEILDKDMLASEARPGLVSAKITLGEILVAIPKGHTGPDVSSLSKQILANPKIVKLLKRADPLAPKKKRSSRSRHRHSSSRRSSSRENVHVLEKLGESPEEEITEEDERRMKAAMRKAKAQASEANAAVADHQNGSNGAGASLSRSDSMTMSVSVDGGDDSIFTESTGSASFDDSYSSWSKSFEASFSVQSSVCSGVSKRAARRRDRQARRLRILKLSAIGAFVVMIAFYLMDPRGKNNDEAHVLNDVVRQTPMGLTGVFQCLFLLLTLYKVERLVRSATANPAGKDSSNGTDGLVSPGSKNIGAGTTSEHRCPFLRASNAAMKRLKAKYAKKLKRAKKKAAQNEGPSSVVSKRLKKNFSLRPSIVTATSCDDDDGRLMKSSEKRETGNK